MGNARGLRFHSEGTRMAVRPRVLLLYIPLGSRVCIGLNHRKVLM